MVTDTPPKQRDYRRTDLAMETVVHAAVKLMPKLGYDATFDFLLDVGIPVEVIKRVLNDGDQRARGS